MAWGLLFLGIGIATAGWCIGCGMQEFGAEIRLAIADAIARFKTSDEEEDS